MIFIYISKFLKISDDNLGVFNIVLMILGQSVRKEPRKVASTVIYLVIVTSYIKLVSFDLYDNIVQVTFGSAEVPFENYEDLDRINFDIYTDMLYLDRRIPQDDPHLKNMMKRLHVTKNMFNCFDDLIKLKNVICIGHEQGIYEIIRINQKHKRAVAKVARPSIFTEGLKFYAFENASPFGDRFGKILRRVQETSLDSVDSLIRGFDFISRIEKQSELEVDDENDVKQLLLVLLCGYVLAVLAFFGEFVTF